jgi:hypothetical protein
MEQYTPTIHTSTRGNQFAIFTQRQMIDSFMNSLVSFWKIDHMSEQKREPLFEWHNRRLYLTDNHPTPASFILTFLDKSDVNPYIQAIKEFGEAKRVPWVYFTPEILFWYEDEEWYNLYIQTPSNELTESFIPIALMTDDTTTEYRYRWLVLHPDWLPHANRAAISAVVEETDKLLSGKS